MDLRAHLRSRRTMFTESNKIFIAIFLHVFHKADSTEIDCIETELHCAGVMAKSALATRGVHSALCEQ